MIIDGFSAYTDNVISLHVKINFIDTFSEEETYINECSKILEEKFKDYLIDKPKICNLETNYNITRLKMELEYITFKITFVQKYLKSVIDIVDELNISLID